MNTIKRRSLLILSTLPFVGFGQQNYTINGTIGKIQLPATAYVVYQQSGKMQFDSAAVQRGGKFLLKGTVSVPTKGYLMVSRDGGNLLSRPNPDQVGIYLENGTIEFTTPDSMFRAKVGGTPLNQDQQEMVNLLAPLKNQAKETEQAEENFIIGHPESLVSLNLLRGSFNPQKDRDKADRLFTVLSPELQASAAGQSYLSSIGKAKVVNVGTMAPDFILKNVKGEDVSLASFKGKYVLIDFWASWCIPCRQENPNVVRAYEKFKGKNFTILGVSLDGGENGRRDWLAAIAKDNLNWEQVSDLMGWGNYAVQLYHLNAVPANFLLDPTGKIIGKNLRGEELQTKLASIL